MRIQNAWLLSLLLAVQACDNGAAGIDGAGGGRPTPISGDGGVECAHPEEGCACEPGRAPIDCYLDPIRSPGGTLTCNQGTRYCRDGVWTGCESVREYVTGGTGAALISGPEICNPCDPRCFEWVDTPNDADLPGVSTDISYSPTRGGIELTPQPPTPEMLTDTDGDGVPDVADECVGPGAFRNADGTCYGDDFLYHTLPYGTSAVDPLDISIQIRTADVYFLIDTTGSMGGEIARLRTDLTSGSFIAGCTNGIMGAIRCTMPDSWFGVGYYDDYPNSPYGSSGDRVYRNVQSIAADLAPSQTAVNGLTASGGNDGPESQTQALWAMATGNGLASSSTSYLAARGACAGGGWGYPCFRDGTIPIVIHITDAPFHNGPAAAYPYCIGGTYTAPSLPTATSVGTNDIERMDATAYPRGGNAIDITGAWVGFEGNTSGMANDHALGCGAGASDAVFRVRLTSAQLTTFTLQGSSYDTVLAVVPVAGGATLCNDDAVGTASRISAYLPAGDYWVVVDGWSTSSGSYRLSMGVAPEGTCTGYSGVSWNDTVTALRDRNVKVITFVTCGGGDCTDGHASALGNATGSVDSSGSPYVFYGASDGTGLSDDIVDAVVDLANFSRMDISARAVGDTEGFTDSITAVGFPPGRCEGIASGTTFLQCLPGTTVDFNVTFHNDVVMPTTTTQIFEFFIEIVGDGTVVLQRVPVRIVVPATVGSYPASGSYWHDYDSTERCAINERPDWGDLAWTADVPSGTRIEFELRAADTAAELPGATPARITVPTATSPRDIAAALRAAGYPDGMRHLRVTAVLHSDTARTASPLLTDMNVQYTCLPAE